MSAAPCSHLSSILILEGPDEVDGCDTCLAEGGTWLHLRMCMTCGVVGCCDDSPNQHARKHAEAESHPIVRSIEPRENWCYCYPEDSLFYVAGAEPIAEPPLPHTFRHDIDGGRIELWVGDNVVGWIDYSPVGEAISLTNTEIQVGNTGLGYEEELVLEAIRMFGVQKKALIPADEFALEYIAKRPALHDAVAPRMRGRLQSSAQSSAQSSVEAQ